MRCSKVFNDRHHVRYSAVTKMNDYSILNDNKRIVTSRALKVKERKLKIGLLACTGCPKVQQ